METPSKNHEKNQPTKGRALSEKELERIQNDPYLNEKNEKAREFFKNANWDEWLKVLKG